MFELVPLQTTPFFVVLSNHIHCIRVSSFAVNCCFSNTTFPLCISRPNILSHIVSSCSYCSMDTFLFQFAKTCLSNIPHTDERTHGRSCEEFRFRKSFPEMGVFWDVKPSKGSILVQDL